MENIINTKIDLTILDCSDNHIYSINVPKLNLTCGESQKPNYNSPDKKGNYTVYSDMIRGQINVWKIYEVEDGEKEYVFYENMLPVSENTFSLDAKDAEANLKIPQAITLKLNTKAYKRIGSTTYSLWLEKFNDDYQSYYNGLILRKGYKNTIYSAIQLTETEMSYENITIEKKEKRLNGIYLMIGIEEEFSNLEIILNEKEGTFYVDNDLI